jgi:hypothetical protein
LFVNRLIACFKSAVYLQKNVELPFAIVLDPTKIGTGQDYLDPNVTANILFQWQINAGNVFVVDYEGKSVDDPAYDKVVIDGEDVLRRLRASINSVLY